MEEAVRLWSSEALYRAIMQKRERIIETIAIDVQAPSGANGLRNGDEDRAKTNENELREWARRLQMARGVVPGLLDRLVGELPRVKTPWERLLRNHLYRHLGKRNIVDFARPSRRWLGLERDMQQREGVALSFEPDRTRPNPSGRIAVAVDTSGSIDDAVLKRFGARWQQLWVALMQEYCWWCAMPMYMKSKNW